MDNDTHETDGAAQANRGIDTTDCIAMRCAMNDGTEAPTAIHTPPVPMISVDFSQTTITVPVSMTAEWIRLLTDENARLREKIANNKKSVDELVVMGKEVQRLFEDAMKAVDEMKEVFANEFAQSESRISELQEENRRLKRSRRPREARVKAVDTANPDDHGNEAAPPMEATAKE